MISRKRLAGLLRDASRRARRFLRLAGRYWFQTAGLVLGLHLLAAAFARPLLPGLLSIHPSLLEDASSRKEVAVSGLLVILLSQFLGRLVGKVTRIGPVELVRERTELLAARIGELNGAIHGAMGSQSDLPPSGEELVLFEQGKIILEVGESLAEGEDDSRALALRELRIGVSRLALRKGEYHFALRNLRKLWQNEKAGSHYEGWVAHNLAWVQERLAETAPPKERARLFDQALNLYRRAAAADPGDEWPWVGIAWIHDELGNLRDAEISLRRACKLQPRNAKIFYNLACVRSKRGRLKGSYDALTEIDSTLVDYRSTFQVLRPLEDTDLRNLLANTFYGPKVRAFVAALAEPPAE